MFKPICLFTGKAACQLVPKPTCVFMLKSTCQLIPIFSQKNAPCEIAKCVKYGMRQEGLEPPTYWFVASHSIQLSYWRTFNFNIISLLYDFVKSFLTCISLFTFCSHMYRRQTKYRLYCEYTILYVLQQTLYGRDIVIYRE